MGKLPVKGPFKPGQSQANKSTRVIKESDRKKTPASKKLCWRKRLLMFQRRVLCLLNEKKSLETKNKEILEHLQSEKMLSASLKKEMFNWQRLYHESTITTNTYKEKLAEIARVLRNNEREIDSSYPHLVHLTGLLTTTKTTIRSVLSSLPSSVGEQCFEQLQNSEKTNDDLNKKSENRMEQRVGPMVRGMLITKPKIMLERIMLPQPQHDQVNDDLPTMEENIQLTPIPEENEHEENLHLRHISIRPKRKLGSSWREKHQEKIEKDRKREQTSNTPLSETYNDEDISDAESNPANIEHVEPVVFIRDVSRLLQNTSLLKVDAVLAENSENRVKHFSKHLRKENAHQQRHIIRTSEDPLEGSSWMYNTIRQCNFRPPQLKSDSTDDEDDEFVPNGSLLNVSLSRNSLDINNQSLVAPNQRIRKGLSVATVDSTCDELPVAEPDSTNDIDTNLNNTLTETISNNIETTSPTKSKSYSKSDNSMENNTLSQTSLLSSNGSINIQSANQSFQRRSSLVLSRKNSSYKNQQSPVEVDGKRMRKPKKHLYPGEEDENPVIKKKNIKQPKISTGKKPLLDNGKGMKKVVDRKRFVKSGFS